MSLKSAITQNYEDRHQDIKSLEGTSNSESYLSENQRDRYFFELIQNARDACVEYNGKKLIKILVMDNTLYVANTGYSFEEQAISKISTIGDSTKIGNKYIGHKGIGFLSTIQITDCPKIITSEGTIYFSKKETAKFFEKVNKYPNQGIVIKNIPLFTYPHFDENLKIENTNFKDFTTIVELPLKKNEDIVKIKKRFNEDISFESIIFLGYIDEISFQQDQESIKYSILTNVHPNYTEKKENTEIIQVKVSKNNTDEKEFIVFKKNILSPKNLIEDDDLKIDNGQIEIAIAFEYKEDKLLPIEQKKDKIYVYYPTNVFTGLNYLIHSYFYLKPDRTALANVKLNNHILKEMALFFSNQVLDFLKANFPYQINELLYFNEQEDFSGYGYYDNLKEFLSNKEFIFDGQKFHKIQNILLCEEDDIKCFGNNLIDDIYLINIGDSEIEYWLRNTLGANYLTEEKLEEKIERICKEKLDNNNYEFFENLYPYLKEKRWHFGHKRILLTEKDETKKEKLVSGKDKDIFSHPEKNPGKEAIELPESFNKYLIFLNKKIKISKPDEFKDFIGIKKYDFEDIIRAMKNNSENNEPLMYELLQFLKKYYKSPTNKSIDFAIVPYLSKDEIGWARPIDVYINNKNLIELYWKKNGLFVNDETLSNKIRNYNKEEWDKFFISIGVWDVPKIIYKKEISTISIQRLNRIKGYSIDHRDKLYLEDDIYLDIPSEYNTFFFDSIINKWEKYIKIISKYRLILQTDTWNSRPNSLSGKQNLHASSFLDTLTDEKWIPVELNKKLKFYSPIEIIGIKESNPRKINLIKKYYPTINRDYNKNKDFFDDLEILHLEKYNYVEILNRIREKYPNPEYSKEFIEFYNYIIRNLYFTYSGMDNYQQYSLLKELENTKFLAIVSNSSLLYLEPKNILFIDDKESFEFNASYNEELNNHPLFTSQNKNEFGHIALKIDSIIYSKNIDRKISQDEYYIFLSINDLLKKFKIEERDYQCIILLAETQLGFTINENPFITTDNFKIAFLNKLDIKIGFKNKYVNSHPPFFIEKKNEILYIYLKNDINEDERNLLFKELIEKILGKSINNFDSLIKDYLSRKGKEKKNFLLRRGIDEARIKELNYDFEEKIIPETEDFLTENDMSNNIILDNYVNKEESVTLSAKNIKEVPSKKKIDSMIHEINNIDLEKKIKRIKVINYEDYESNNKKTERKKRFFSGESSGREYNPPTEDLGEKGEKIIYDYEENRLMEKGISKKVRNVSKLNIGCDIISYGDDEKEIYIEVKTTNKISFKDEFEISRNEVDLAKSKAKRYYLYRLIIGENENTIIRINDPFSNIKIEELDIETENVGLKSTMFKCFLLK